MDECKYCMHHIEETDECTFCRYETDEEKLYRSLRRDDWDILNLDDDEEWSHLQIQKRLHRKGIDCVSCDVWVDDNVAWLMGCNAKSFEIARALNIHEETVYNDADHSFVILNLFQEKWLRGEL